MNMDKYFMWIHFERLHNHNKTKHDKNRVHISWDIRYIAYVYAVRQRYSSGNKFSSAMRWKIDEFYKDMYF